MNMCGGIVYNGFKVFGEDGFGWGKEIGNIWCISDREMDAVVALLC